MSEELNKEKKKPFKYDRSIGCILLHSARQKINSNYKEFIGSLRTLGGGNHFIEFNRSIQTGKEYITINTCMH